jgi:hypothetical protein
MRFYSSVAGQMTLTTGISSLDTVMTVNNTAGLPGSTPYTLIVEPGTVSEEIVTVSSVASNTLTVIRGEDGTVGAAHSAGSVVEHAASARDLREPQQHIAATTGVHGVAGSVVGTTDTQTLSGKSISGSTNTLTNVPSSALPATTVYTTTTQTLSGKTISGGANTLTSIPDSALVALDASKLIGSNDMPKGTMPTDTVFTGATQTLTGKTLTAPAMTTATVSSGGLAVTGGVVTDTLSATGLVAFSSFLNTTITSGTAAAWTDCGTSIFPNASVTVPVSGRVRVTVSATGQNTTTATSTAWLSFRLTATTAAGSITAPGSGTGQTLYMDSASIPYTTSGTGRQLLSTQSQGFFGVRQTSAGGRGSTTTVFTGLTPGTNFIAIPQYFFSSTGSGTQTILDGVITVEPMA